MRRKLKFVLHSRLKRVPNFRYFGVKTYFPRDCLIFRLACEQGIYEHENLRVLSEFSGDGLFIDVGASIGLMSIPILATHPDAKVLSVEASPATVRYLQRTRNESNYANRWSISHCAAGDHTGEVDFYCGTEPLAAYDGVKDTGRGGGKAPITVTQNTLDNLWKQAGSPAVDVVKLDIEGGETAALRGAHGMIVATRPVICLEWNSENLRAYGLDHDALLDLAGEYGYGVYSVPALSRVTGSMQLKATMSFSETFLLLPGRA